MLIGAYGSHYYTTTTGYSTTDYYTTTETTTTRTTNYENCGGKITSAQTIATPFFPSNYPFYAECEWEIELDSGFEIVPKVFEVELPTSEAKYCWHDVLFVYTDGVDRGFCGSNTDSIDDWKSRRKQIRNYAENRLIFADDSKDGFPEGIITKNILFFLRKI